MNGFAGVDFLGADAAGYATAGDALLETGVTAYLPTFITSAEDDLVSALHAVPDSPRGPRILGAHLEGPFLSPLRLGTHGLRGRRDPDAALPDRLRERQVGLDLVAVAAAVLLLDDVPGLGEIGDDAVGGALGDARPGRDVAQPHARVVGDAQQHPGVVGQEAPLRHARKLP